MNANADTLRHGAIRGSHILWLLLAWLLFSAGPVGAQEPALTVNVKSELKETEYCLDADQCRYCWTTYQSDVNRGVLHARNRCDRPMAAQLVHLEQLLARIDAAEAGRQTFKTLFWGRLAPDPAQDGGQMAMRLALAAFQSPEWNKAAGQPVSGHANDMVRRLANTAGIYPELKDLFAASGRKIQIQSVEKVLVAPARHMPFFEHLKAKGVQPDDRLPFDCLVWFGLIGN